MCFFVFESEGVGKKHHGFLEAHVPLVFAFPVTRKPKKHMGFFGFDQKNQKKTREDQKLQKLQKHSLLGSMALVFWFSVFLVLGESPCN